MRKTDRLIAAVIVLAMALTFVFTGCTNAAPDMKISIDGKEFELGCKVSDILDAGLELASIDSASHIITEYPELEARTLLQNSLFIYKNGESSHVAIYVMNKTVNAMTLDECIVYAFKYDCGTFSDNASRTPGIKVLFNGIDFRFAERHTVLSSLESRGFRFKDADKQDFLKSGDAYSTSPSQIPTGAF